MIEECYERVFSGEQAKIVIEANSDEFYREKLETELDEIENQEIWRTEKKNTANYLLNKDNKKKILFNNFYC